MELGGANAIQAADAALTSSWDLENQLWSCHFRSCLLSHMWEKVKQIKSWKHLTLMLITKFIRLEEGNICYLRNTIDKIEFGVL